MSNWFHTLNQTPVYKNKDYNLECESIVRYSPVTCTQHVPNLGWLASNGPYLMLYTKNSQTGEYEKKFETRIFSYERIRGVKILSDKELKFICFGGKSVRFIKINNGETISSEFLSVEYQLKDWILDLILVDDFKFNALLAHNIVLSIKFDNDCNLLDDIQVIYGPVNCLLYSGRFLSSQYVGIGTIFNQVIVWDYSTHESNNEKYTGKIMCQLEGHEGVIFNIHFTPNFHKLVSVSDDRTIRIWTRNNLDSDAWSYQLTHTIFGHTNRIWDCQFLPGSITQLVSISEDSFCKLWEIAEGGEWTCKMSWLATEGKNVWSIGIHSDGKRVLVGGNDGGVRLFNLQTVKKVENESELCFNLALPQLNTYHHEIIPTLNDVQDDETVVVKSKPLKDFIRNFAPLTPNACIGVSDLGYLFKLQLNQVDQNWEAEEPQLIAQVPELVHYCMVGGLDRDLTSASAGPPVVLGSLSGELIACRPLESSNHTENLISNSAEGQFSISKFKAFDTKIVTLKLVPYDEKCYLLVAYAFDAPPKVYLLQPGHGKEDEWKWTLIGSIQSDRPVHPMAIAFHSASGHLSVGTRQGDLLIYHIDVDANCHIQHLQTFDKIHSSESVTSTRYLSTDDPELVTGGRDGAYRTYRWNGSRYDVKLYSKLTKGWIEGIQIVDGEIILIYFFRKRLIVFNVTRTIELFSIQCGGGHREWYLNCLNGALTRGSVVYLRKEKIVMYPIVPSPLQSTGEIGNDTILKTGLHGREIRSLARTVIGEINILATGGEEGKMKLFTQTPDALRCHLTLKAHHSVIRNLQFIVTPTQHYLVSAGGCEELKLWELSFRNGELSLIEVFRCEVFQKELEVRIMAIEFIQMDSTNGYGVLVVGYSDGFVRCFKFDPTANAPLQLVRSTRFLDRCVLSIASTKSSSDPLETVVACGTTGGKIGWFRLGSLIDPTQSTGPFAVEQVHQSGVNCLDAQCTGDQVQFVSGGEDNSIAVIQLHANRCTVQKFEKAHASAVQGIRFFKNNEFVTVGLDQRLMAWKTNPDCTISESIQTLPATLGALTAVPDPSDLQAWRYESSSETYQIGIVGIGLELFEIRLK